MQHVKASALGIRGGDIHYAIMKMTPAGMIDICSYHDSYADAAQEFMGEGYNTSEYEIVRIDREEVEP